MDFYYMYPSARLRQCLHGMHSVHGPLLQEPTRQHLAILFDKKLDYEIQISAHVWSTTESSKET